MSLGAAALVVGIVGTVISGVSAYSQAKYQASIAKMNAKINEQNAERAAYAGQIEAQDQGFRNRAIIGQAIADQASSGLDLSSGSYALERKNLRELSSQDQARLQQQGQVEAYNFRVAAANNRAEASLANSQATGALVSTAFNLGSTVLGSSLISGAKTTGKVNFLGGTPNPKIGPSFEMFGRG